MRKKNIIVIVSCIVMSSLFIGAALPSVFAGAVTSDNVASGDDDDCHLCRELAANEVIQNDCKTCNEAVSFAVGYMMDHVKDNVDGLYYEK